MTQPETTIIAGSGVQTHPALRWGNYSSMDVDPLDDCTFWYTTEYYQATSSAGWRTRVASFRNSECGRKPPPPEEAAAFEYAAKLVCGLQRDPKRMQLVRGFYGTAVNIHNSGDKPITLRKRLALTFPPDQEKPGKIIPIAQHKLGPDEALEVDCEDVLKEVFNGQFPTPYIKGFVVVQSSDRLDVTAVYTAAGLDKEGNVTSVTSIDVDRVYGRRKREKQPPGTCPDLVIKDIGPPFVSCPGGGGTCVTKIDYTVANLGTADAGPFNVRAVLDPGQSVVVDTGFGGGLSASADQTVSITTPPGGNCFDPDCTISVTADSKNDVKECDKSNNTLSETSPG